MPHTHTFKGLLLTVTLACCGTALAQSRLADLIQNGSRLEALELIDQGADVNAAQGDGTTPLHWAVYKIDVPLVDKLLEHGANAAVVNRFGSSPLAEAVKVAHVALEFSRASVGPTLDLALG